MKTVVCIMANGGTVRDTGWAGWLRVMELYTRGSGSRIAARARAGGSVWREKCTRGNGAQA